MILAIFQDFSNESEIIFPFLLWKKFVTVAIIPLLSLQFISRVTLGMIMRSFQFFCLLNQPGLNRFYSIIQMKCSKANLGIKIIFNRCLSSEVIYFSKCFVKSLLDRLFISFFKMYSKHRISVKLA